MCMELVLEDVKIFNIAIPRINNSVVTDIIALNKAIFSVSQQPPIVGEKLKLYHVNLGALEDWRQPYYVYGK
jgi:hypothetical protein